MHFFARFITSFTLNLQFLRMITFDCCQRRFTTGHFLTILGHFDLDKKCRSKYCGFTEGFLNVQLTYPNKRCKPTKMKQICRHKRPLYVITDAGRYHLPQRPLHPDLKKRCFPSPPRLRHLKTQQRHVIINAVYIFPRLCRFLRR